MTTSERARWLVGGVLAAWAIGLLVGIELMFFGIALISGGRTVDHTAPTGARTV